MPSIPLLAASPSAGLVNPTQPHWESVSGRRTWSLNRNLRQVELGWEICKLSVHSYICIPRFVRLCLSISWCVLLLWAFQWIHEKKILPWAPQDPNTSLLLGLHWLQGFYPPTWEPFALGKNSVHWLRPHFTVVSPSSVGASTHYHSMMGCKIVVCVFPASWPSQQP